MRIKYVQLFQLVKIEGLQDVDCFKSIQKIACMMVSVNRNTWELLSHCLTGSYFHERSGKSLNWDMVRKIVTWLVQLYKC